MMSKVPQTPHPQTVVLLVTNAHRFLVFSIHKCMVGATGNESRRWNCF